MKAMFYSFAAIADAGERVRFALRHPGMLSGQRLVALEGTLASRLEQDTGLHERLAELDAVRQMVAQDASAYPFGHGPVDRAAQEVLDREITLNDAMQRVGYDDVAWHLTDLYVSILCWHMQQQVFNGDLKRAMTGGRLLAHACREACPGGKVNEPLLMACSTWLQAAGVALGSHPDGEIFNAARTFGEQILQRLPIADDPSRGDVLHSLGCLHSDPVTSSSSAAGMQWAVPWGTFLAVEQGDLLARQRAKAFPVPAPADMLRKASSYFEEALPGRKPGAERGTTLKALAQTELHLARSESRPADTGRIEQWCLSALSELPQDHVQAHNARALLRMMGKLPEEEGPLREAPELPDEILQAANALMASEPARALELLAGAKERFATAVEPQRNLCYSLQIQLIPHVLGSAGLTGLPDDPYKALKTLAERAAGQHWSENRLAATLFHLAMQSAEQDHEQQGLQALAAATKLPATLRDYPEAVGFLALHLSIGAGVNAFLAGDLAGAVEHYCRGLAPALRMQLPSTALDLMHRLADVAQQSAGPGKTAPPDMVTKIIATLATLTGEIDAALQAPGEEAMRVLCQALLAASATTGSTATRTNMGAIELLLQLGKGHRFDALLRQGVKNWSLDAETAELRQRMSELQARTDFENSLASIGDLELCSASGVREPADGDDDRARLHNLQLSMDRRLRHRLAAGIEAEPFRPPHEIAGLLDKRTVLLDYALMDWGNSQRGVLIVLHTAEEVVGFINPVQDSGDVVIDHSQGAFALDSLGMRTYRLRLALQQEPQHGARLSDLAEKYLSEDFELLLGTPTWERLELLRKKGKDHLCIRPYSALRYYPMHLLGPPGHDLAQDWIVTYLPSLELALRRNPSPRTGAAVLGLTYEGDRWHRLQPLDNAKAEVEQIAALLGAKPLLDAEVTERAVFAALLKARWVHLCAHGMHSPASPLFHQLILSPDGASDGRLCAYQLIGHDLQGLEVLTLGSCDSALGRFDAADNLAGLPAAFFISGVQTVIGALWELEDSAASLFFVKFYAALSKGQSRLDSFRLAQLALRAARPEARAWGALCFQGVWRTSGKRGWMEVVKGLALSGR